MPGFCERAVMGGSAVREVLCAPVVEPPVGDSDPAAIACDLESKVRALSASSTYPESPKAIQSIETHFAWVFLGDEYAYKLKKPVRIVDMDLRLLEARAADCAEEVRLNRRLAPDIYLGLAALTLSADRKLAIDGTGEVVDWLVKMKKLPADAMLDRAIASKSVSAERAQALGEVLAKFYASQPRIQFEPEAYVHRMQARIEEDRRQLLDPMLTLNVDSVERLAESQMRALQRLESQLSDRAARGRILEAHGDLRPEHVCLSDLPCVIDALEFSLELRTLDPVEELAFFHLECEQLGAAWVARTVIDVYRNRCSDVFTPALFSFYRSRRASIRAKLIAWHLLDPLFRALEPWAARANGYVNKALTYSQAVDCDSAHRT